MRKVCTLSAILAFASVLAYAETFTGRLFDASCVEQHKNEQTMEACMATSTTASFAIKASGKMLKLDEDGNRKAAEAWKEYNSSADRAADADASSDPATATVEGTLSGDEIKVESIDIR
jgi:hypothetical protein